MGDGDGELHCHKEKASFFAVCISVFSVWILPYTAVSGLSCFLLFLALFSAMVPAPFACFPPSFRFVLFHDLSFFFVFPFPPPPCSRASIYTCVHVCVWWHVSECADVFCSLVLCYRTCLVLSCFSTGPEHHIIMSFVIFYTLCLASPPCSPPPLTSPPFPKTRPGVFDVSLLSGSSGLPFDSPFPVCSLLFLPLALSVLSFFSERSILLSSPRKILSAFVCA